MTKAALSGGLLASEIFPPYFFSNADCPARATHSYNSVFVETIGGQISQKIANLSGHILGRVAQDYLQ